MENLVETNDINIPKKRGRKPKVKTEEELIEKVTVKKKRGRKPSGKIFEVDENTGIVGVPNCIIAHLPLSEKEILKITGEVKKEPQPEQKVIITKKQINFNIETSEDLKHSLNEKCRELENLKKKYVELETKYKKYSYLETVISDNGIIDKKYYIPNSSVIDEDGKTWKTSTDLWCSWCMHTFDTVPVGLPEMFCNKTKKFYTRDCFCSFNCAHAFNLSLNDYKIWERFALLSRIKNMVYKSNDNQFSSKSICYAPPRKVLKVLGGTMSIDEFRNDFISIPKEYHCLLPPSIPLFSVIEEIPKFFNQSKTNNFDKLKIRRNKPLPMKNNNLMNLLSIT